jgi:hypothetical protein
MTEQYAEFAPENGLSDLTQDGAALKVTNQ